MFQTYLQCLTNVIYFSPLGHIITVRRERELEGTHFTLKSIIRLSTEALLSRPSAMLTAFLAYWVSWTRMTTLCVKLPSRSFQTFHNKVRLLFFFFLFFKYRTPNHTLDFLTIAEENKDKLRTLEGIPKIVNLFASSKLEIKERAAVTISNLSDDRTYPPIGVLI